MDPSRAAPRISNDSLMLIMEFQIGSPPMKPHIGRIYVIPDDMARAIREQPGVTPIDLAPEA